MVITVKLTDSFYKKRLGKMNDDKELSGDQQLEKAAR